LEEATRKATIGALEVILKRQRLTITNLQDVGVKLLQESDVDSAWFEHNLAGIASHILHLHDLSSLTIGVSQSSRVCHVEARRESQKHCDAISTESVPMHTMLDLKLSHI